MRDCNVCGRPFPLFVLVFEVHYVDLLTGMPGPNVRHHVGRLLAAELAIRALEARRLTALVLVVPGHIALDSEAAAALGTTERFVVGERDLRMIGISHATMREVIRHRPRHGRAVLAKIPIAAIGLEALAGLQHEVQIQLRGCRVKT